MPFCHKCGAQTLDEASFCKECGAATQLSSQMPFRTVGITATMGVYCESL